MSDPFAPDVRSFFIGLQAIGFVPFEVCDVDGLLGQFVNLGQQFPAPFQRVALEIVAETEIESYEAIRKLTSLFGNQGKIANEIPELDLAKLLPESGKRAYDVHPLIAGLLDKDSESQELFPKWAPNITIALGRLGGRTVGVVANNPLRLGGCLDSSSAEKAARFVRLCDSFGIPLVVLVDVPGYLPGVQQEWNGIIRHGAKLLWSYSEATVPKFTVVVRKDYGGAYVAMSSKHLGADMVFAWPTAEIAVMGAKGAVEVISNYKKEIAGAEDNKNIQQEKQ